MLKMTVLQAMSRCDLEHELNLVIFGISNVHRREKYCDGTPTRKTMSASLLWRIKRAAARTSEAIENIYDDDRLSSEVQVTLVSALKAAEAIQSHLERFYDVENCALQPKESE